MNDYLLIVANSGRMLAEAAKRAGLTPLVVDLYADLDTRAIAEAVVRIDAMTGCNVERAVDVLTKRYPVTRALYGSGLEAAPECVEILSGACALLGNDASTLANIQNKRRFFDTLARHGMAYPRVAFDPPEQPGGWLLKPFRGTGGLGIRRYCGQILDTTAVYWQEMIEGVSGSVLFLADGRQAGIIGYNTQWQVRLDSEHEFVFAGVINQSPLSLMDERRVAGWVLRLVRDYGLKGLGSLDFVVRCDEVFVLEINPRPPASLQLYSYDWLSRHIEACSGHLEVPRAAVEGYCGYRIVFAAKTVQIPAHFQWPENCRDLPAPLQIIRKGRPICSMIASGQSPRQLEKKLRATERIIVNPIEKGYLQHGISNQHQSTDSASGR